MASIIKVGNKWRAQVRRAGHKAITLSFDSKATAEKWARKIEQEIDADRYHDGRTTITFAKLAHRYREEIKRGRTADNVIDHLDRHFGALTLDKITQEKIIEYVNERGYGPATATVELSILGTMLKVARVVWKMPVKESVVLDARTSLKMVGKVKKSSQRDRRPTQDEIDRLCAYFDVHAKLPMRDIIDFAIATTMRSTEIANLRWDDYNEAEKTILIRDRKDPKEKIGNDQIVPLLEDALVVIKRRKLEGELIFGHNAGTVSSIFPRACKQLNIDDLRFHDLRHEAISRLFERGYQIHEVALFSGHRSWEQLKRYTQIRAKTLRRL